MSYNPSIPPQLTDDLLPYLSDEFLRAAQVINDISDGQWEVKYKMPVRYKPGTVIYLSGTGDANPLGTGQEGIYRYNTSKVWEYVGGGSGPGPSPVTSVNGKTGTVVLNAGDVGADPSGTATAEITAHVIAPDPHTQYVLKTSLSAVATSGAYSDLTGKPTLFSGAYADLTGKPTLFSGAYADLTGKPTLFSGTWADLTGKPTTFPSTWATVSGKPDVAVLVSTGLNANRAAFQVSPGDPLAVASTGGIELREAAGGASLFDDQYAPRLGFHWSGRFITNLWAGSGSRLMWGGDQVSMKAPVDNLNTRVTALETNSPVTTLTSTGTVIKHASGVMEIFWYEGTKTFTSAPTTTLSWTFPVAFVGAIPVVNFGGAARLAGAIQPVTKQEYGTSLTTVSVRLNAIGTNIDDIRDATWRAVGRWK